MKRLLLLLCLLGFTFEPSLVASDTLPPSTAETPENRQGLETCIRAIASQSDPAKLATLGSRQSNPRLKRIMYYLATAREAGADPALVIFSAQSANGSVNTPRAELVRTSLLRNLKICDGLGLLTPENLERLKRGNAPVVPVAEPVVLAASSVPAMTAVLPVDFMGCKV